MLPPSPPATRPLAPPHTAQQVALPPERQRAKRLRVEIDAQTEAIHKAEGAGGEGYDAGAPPQLATRSETSI